MLVGLKGNRLVQEARKILRGEGKKGQVPTLWDGHTSVRSARTLVDKSTPITSAKPAGTRSPVVIGDPRDQSRLRNSPATMALQAASTFSQQP